jgi:hypothetical protein
MKKIIFLATTLSLSFWCIAQEQKIATVSEQPAFASPTGQSAARSQQVTAQPARSAQPVRTLSSEQASPAAVTSPNNTKIIQAKAIEQSPERNLKLSSEGPIDARPVKPVVDPATFIHSQEKP